MPAGKFYLRNSANDAWISIAQGAGAAGGSATSFDTNFAATLSAPQVITTGIKKVLFDTITYDGNSEWDVANLRWTCKETGYYNINTSVTLLTAYTSYCLVYIYLDGAAIRTGNTIIYEGTYAHPSSITALNHYITAGQYVEIYVSQTGTSVRSESSLTWFNITRYK